MSALGAHTDHFQHDGKTWFIIYSYEWSSCCCVRCAPVGKRGEGFITYDGEHGHYIPEVLEASDRRLQKGFQQNSLHSGPCCCWGACSDSHQAPDDRKDAYTDIIMGRFEAPDQQVMGQQGPAASLRVGKPGEILGGLGKVEPGNLRMFQTQAMQLGLSQRDVAYIVTISEQEFKKADCACQTACVGSALACPLLPLWCCFYWKAKSSDERAERETARTLDQVFQERGLVFSVSSHPRSCRSCAENNEALCDWCCPCCYPFGATITVAKAAPLSSGDPEQRPSPALEAEGLAVPLNKK